MNWIDAHNTAQSGFDEWAGKDHNKKWFRRIDGTPIPNDLVVCIANAIVRETNKPNQDLIAEMVEALEGAREALWDYGAPENDIAPIRNAITKAAGP